MLKIALIGYGQMGHLVDQLAESQNCRVIARIDPHLKTSINKASLLDAEVCIDFSQPDCLLDNIRKIASLKKNIVVGTTGWFEHLPEVQDLVDSNHTALLYGSNFSVGMNIFFQIVAYSSSLISGLPEYDVFGLELHHNKKLDSPSGTAKKLAEIITSQNSRKQKHQFDRVERRIEPEEFHLASIRAGAIPGTHLIGFDSYADTIELKHTARNREGFALGALKAAQWIKDKKGLFCFDQIFPDLI
ncbi:MAG: 4-hydroxy-tetrahydrodipicolinate reductase [Candidatus Cloacimonetes bacterium]|nr:4-hydroxy-tetrahydrodipicolinate reductase [Candidatus Cloacimonadota bacterium]